jgi:hypothetical protein
MGKTNNIVVIFSSHLSKEENQKFIKHIDNTIGCNHITICYPNFNEYSLVEIYNIAIKDHNTVNSIMVFLHNDIIIKTPNWGRIILTKFNNSNYSMIGVAGSTYLPESGKWWEDKSRMVGIVEHTDGFNAWVSEYSKEKKGQITPVVIIDGLFMAINCNNIIHKFDTEFKGFHFYDLSMVFPNFLDGINIGVTTDIRILHKSVGITNNQWEENRKIFVKKYKHDLPFDYNELEN